MPVKRLLAAFMIIAVLTFVAKGSFASGPAVSLVNWMVLAVAARMTERRMPWAADQLRFTALVSLALIVNCWTLAWAVQGRTGAQLRWTDGHAVLTMPAGGGIAHWSPCIDGMWDLCLRRDGKETTLYSYDPMEVAALMVRSVMWELAMGAWRGASILSKNISV